MDPIRPIPRKFDNEIKARQITIRKFYSEPWKIATKNCDQDLTVSLERIIEILSQKIEKKGVKITKFQFAGSIVPCLLGPKALFTFLKEIGRSTDSIPNELLLDKLPYPSDTDCRIYIEGGSQAIKTVRTAFYEVITDLAKNTNMNLTIPFSDEYLNNQTFSIQFNHPERENRVDLVFQTGTARHAIFPFQDLILEKKNFGIGKTHWELIAPQWNDLYLSLTSWCDRVIDLDSLNLNTDQLNHKVWSLLQSYKSIKGYTVTSTAKDGERVLMDKALLHPLGLETIHWDIIKSKASQTKTDAVACGLQAYISYNTIRPTDYRGIPTRWNNLWTKINTENVLCEKEITPLAKQIADCVSQDLIDFNTLLSFLTICSTIFPNKFRYNKNTQAIALPFTDNNLPNIVLPFKPQEVIEKLCGVSQTESQFFLDLITFFSNELWIPDNITTHALDDESFSINFKKLISSDNRWQKELGHLLIMQQLQIGKRVSLTIEELKFISTLWQTREQLNFWSIHLYRTLIPSYLEDKVIPLETTIESLNTGNSLTIWEGLLIDLAASNNPELGKSIEYGINISPSSDDVYNRILDKLSSHSPERSLKLLQKNLVAPSHFIAVAKKIKQGISRLRGVPKEPLIQNLDLIVTEASKNYEIKVGLLIHPQICLKSRDIVNGVADKDYHNAIQNLLQTYTENGDPRYLEQVFRLNSYRPIDNGFWDSFIDRTFSPTRDNNKKRIEGVTRIASNGWSLYTEIAIKIFSKALKYARPQAFTFIQTTNQHINEEARAPLLLELLKVLEDKPSNREECRTVNTLCKSVIKDQQTAQTFITAYPLNGKIAIKMNCWLLDPTKIYLNKALDLASRDQILASSQKVSIPLLNRTINDHIQQGNLKRALELMVDHNISSHNTWLTFFKMVNNSEIAENSLDTWTKIVKDKNLNINVSETSRIILARCICLCKTSPPHLISDFINNNSWIHNVFTMTPKSPASQRAIQKLWPSVDTTLFNKVIPQHLHKSALMATSSQKWSIILSCPGSKINGALPFLQQILEALFAKPHLAFSSLHVNRLKDEQAMLLIKLGKTLTGKLAEYFEKSLGRLALLSQAELLYSAKLAENPLNYLSSNDDEEGKKVLNRYYSNPPGNNDSFYSTKIFIFLLKHFKTPDPLPLNQKNLTEEKLCRLLKIHIEANEISYSLLQALAEASIVYGPSQHLSESLLNQFFKLKDIPTLDETCHLRRAQVWEKIICSSQTLSINFCLNFIQTEGVIGKLFSQLKTEIKPWKVDLLIFSKTFNLLLLKKHRPLLTEQTLSSLIKLFFMLNEEYREDISKEIRTKLIKLILKSEQPRGNSIPILYWNFIFFELSENIDDDPIQTILDILHLFRHTTCEKTVWDRLEPLLQSQLKECSLDFFNQCISKLYPIDKQSLPYIHQLVDMITITNNEPKPKESKETVKIFTDLMAQKNTLDEREKVYRIFRHIRPDETEKSDRLNQDLIYKFYIPLLRASFRDGVLIELNEYTLNALKEFKLYSKLKPITSDSITAPFYNIVRGCFRFLQEQMLLDSEDRPFALETVAKLECDFLRELKSVDKEIDYQWKNLSMYLSLKVKPDFKLSITRCATHTFEVACLKISTKKSISFIGDVRPLRVHMVYFLKKFYDLDLGYDHNGIENSYKQTIKEIDILFNIPLDHENRRMILFTLTVYLDYLVLEFNGLDGFNPSGYLKQYIQKLYELSPPNQTVLEEDLITAAQTLYSISLIHCATTLDPSLAHAIRIILESDETSDDSTIIKILSIQQAFWLLMETPSLLSLNLLGKILENQCKLIANECLTTDNEVRNLFITNIENIYSKIRSYELCCPAELRHSFAHFKEKITDILTSIAGFRWEINHFTVDCVDVSLEE